MKNSHLIQEDETCFLIARDFNNSESENITRVIVNNIYQLAGLRNKIVKNINIKLNFNQSNENILKSIENINKEYEGNHPLVLHLNNNNNKTQKVLIKKLKFSIEKKTLFSLRKICGDNNVWLSI